MIYVDPLFDYGWHWGESCHLTADTIEELKLFGESIGLKLKWIHTADSGVQYFNITANKRRIAIQKGAIETAAKIGFGWQSLMPKPKEQKTITFRPLYRIKKTGKIVVASYMQWRKVMTADYNKFNLIVDNEYKEFPLDEFVYNHKGELLFFFTYNPADIPVYDSTAERMKDEDWLDKLHQSKQQFGIRWGMGEPSHTNYKMDGADCSGVPTFTHWTEDRITQEDTWNYYGHDKFEPLTVETVTKWFGWFLFQLNNSYLQIGR